jgi:hypothetical protein
LRASRPLGSPHSATSEEVLRAMRSTQNRPTRRCMKRAKDGARSRASRPACWPSQHGSIGERELGLKKLAQNGSSHTGDGGFAHFWHVTGAACRLSRRCRSRTPSLNPQAGHLFYHVCVPLEPAPYPAKVLPRAYSGAESASTPAPGNRGPIALTSLR